MAGIESGLITLAYDVLAIAAPVGAALLVEFLRRRLGTEKMKRISAELEAKQELAAMAVRFVEQAYLEYDGPEKFNKAADRLADRARGHGINISSDEIQELIESTLRAMKDTYGEEWAKAVCDEGRA